MDIQMVTPNTGNGSKVPAPINFSQARSADILLASVIIDPEFNSRTNVDGNDLDSTSVQNVADSLSATGQVTPILVERRVVKTGKTESEKYFLISGFRRVSAAQKLGWDTIAARVFEPMSESARRYLNLIENTAREDLSSYDLAMACVPLSRMGESSGDISAKLGKSDSYMRALLGIVEGTKDNPNKATPAILRRWQMECGPLGKGHVKVCTTDWLAKTCKLDANAQDLSLNAVMESKAKKGDPDFKEKTKDSTGDVVEGTDKPDVVKARNKVAVLNAKLILMEKIKTEKDVARREHMKTSVDVLRWVLGNEDEIKSEGIGTLLGKDEKLAV